MSLNISDFNWFFIGKLHPPQWKMSPPSFPATPSRSWGLVKPPPPFENLVGGSERGVHTMWLPFINFQMVIAHVYQNKCFQNKPVGTQTKSENGMHTYWHNIDTNWYSIDKYRSKLEINAFDVRHWKNYGDNWNFPCGQQHCSSIISVATS